MSANLAIWAINFYRKHLSRRKGYSCAYGVCTGRATCSKVGLRVFDKGGWIKGWALLRRQFDRCAICADELSKSRVEAGAREGLAARRAGIGSQGGFVDCSGCDAPSCDVPSCELPDVPSCEFPDVPSCGLPDMPSCEAPGAQSCRSGTEAGACGSPCRPGAWEFLYCLDCEPTGASGHSKAEGAKKRQSEEQEARDRRRAEAGESRALRAEG